MRTPRAIQFVGAVYFAKLNSSRVRESGYLKAGNIYPLSLQVETETKTMPSAMPENAGQTLWSDTRITGISGSGTLRELIPETFAWLLAGTVSAMTGVGGTVTDEAVTAIEDQFVPLAHPKVSSVVVQDVTDTTTYTLGTDYTLNANLGLIQAIEGGGISTDDVLHVDYSYAAESGNQIEVGTEELIRVAILLDGKNRVTGNVMRGEFDSVVIGSAGEIELISDPTADYGEFPMNLTFETLTGQESPGRIKEFAS